MAERLRKFHQDDVRTKIQTSQLINRLTDHGLGKLDLSATQVRSIEILLKKTLPDLTSIEGSIGIHDDRSDDDIDGRIAALQDRIRELAPTEAREREPDRLH